MSESKQYEIPMRGESKSPLLDCMGKFVSCNKTLPAGLYAAMKDDTAKAARRRRGIPLTKFFSDQAFISCIILEEISVYRVGIMDMGMIIDLTP